MVAGILDLIARGKKDTWMIKSSDNPNINIKILEKHFLSVFRKYSTMIKEYRQIPFTGTNFGKQAKVILPNFCDMYSEIYLQLQIQSFLDLDSSPEISINDYQPVNNEDNYGYVDNIGYSCIDKIELWTGNIKLDEYDHLELYTDFIEKHNNTQRILLERKLGGRNITINNEYYKNQGGNIFFRIPFYLFQKYRPLPTWCFQSSPLELKIKFKKLTQVASPSSNINIPTLTLGTKNSLYTHNITGDTISIRHRKPRIRFAMLHIEGIHIPIEARNEIQKYYSIPRKIPVTTYRQQEILLRENESDPNNVEICVGTTFRIPSTGNIAKFPIQLQFDLPVRTFHIIPQLELKRNNLQYYDFIIDNSTTNTLTNCEIIQDMELQVQGKSIYPPLPASYYSVVTPYEVNTNTLSRKTFLIPFETHGNNIHESIGEINTSYINYSMVKHSTLNINIQGWDANYNRAMKLYIIAKCWSLYELHNGFIRKVNF
jgi:hypothetical protein